ncbi:aminoacyl-tRNA hydrolase [soil metagenome]
MEYVVVALGNPGARYANTRHNIGWLVADSLAGAHTWNTERRPVGLEWCSLSINGSLLHLLKPHTYMNLSGEAAQLFAGRLKLSSERIIAVVDEYNFPVGRVHLRMGGSDGGHNGLTSMIEELGTDKFWRLRCGIDRKFGPGELVDYVLAPFGSEEVEARNAMISSAVDALRLIASVGPEKAMQTVNRVA